MFKHCPKVGNDIFLPISSKEGLVFLLMDCAFNAGHPEHYRFRDFGFLTIFLLENIFPYISVCIRNVMSS